MIFFHVFAGICLPIFVMIGIGWVLDRFFNLDLRTLVKLNIFCLVPAFIFTQIVSSKDLTAGEAGRAVLMTLAIMVLMFLIGGLIGWARKDGLQARRSIQIGAMFYNSGNYGIPLMTLAFPATGPALQVFIILTQNVCNFTIGIFLVSHRPGQSLWQSLSASLRQLSPWAAVLAFVVRGFEIPVQTWKWLWTPLQYASAALVGIALFTLGAQLAKTKVHECDWGRLAATLGLRLILGPLLAFALAPLFGFSGENAKVMTLSAAFPTAVNTALLAHEFKGDSEFAASVVFYSTMASMLTVTALVTLLKVS